MSLSSPIVTVSLGTAAPLISAPLARRGVWKMAWCPRPPRDERLLGDDGQILALREHLIAEQVTLVVLATTGDYWKPFYYLLEDAPFEVVLVNARQVTNVPGRQTDVSDATWLAQLGAHGLVRGSFVPPQPVRELPDLTRTRTSITREQTREWQRLEKLLGDAGVELTSVATDLSGPSGWAMLDAMTDGQRDPAVLAELARARLRTTIPALEEALTGRFTEHHAFLTRLHVTLIDQHTHAVDEITNRIEVVIEPLRRARELIITVPGTSTTLADVIIAETGADMTRSPTAGHLASWAGTTPGSHGPARRVRSTQTRPGNPYHTGALGSPRSASPAANSTPGWPPATGASPPAAAPGKPWSRSSTPCSPRSGT